VTSQITAILSQKTDRIYSLKTKPKQSYKPEETEKARHENNPILALFRKIRHKNQLLITGMQNRRRTKQTSLPIQGQFR